MPKCPECGSDKTWKDGLRYIQDTPVQRFLCRNCSYRFSKTSSNASKDPECTQRVQRMALNMPSNLLGNRQICVTATRAAKNLVAEQEEKNSARKQG